MMRRLAVLLIVMLLSAPVVFADVMIGRHKVRGKTPDGSSYRGALDISFKDGEFLFRWYITSGEVYDGHGKLVGDTLTIYWEDPAPVIYKVEPNGVLRGTWGGGAGTEVVTPEKATVAFNKLGEDCDPEVYDADKLIKGCTELLSLWKGPTGKSSDSMVPTYFLMRAEAYGQKEDYDKALSDVESALKLSPKIPGAFSLRSWIHDRRNELKLALEDIDKAIALTVPPYDPSAADHYSRGTILENLGDAAGAKAAYEQALKIDPEYQKAKARLSANPRDDCITNGLGDLKNISGCTKFLATNPTGPDLAEAYSKRGYAYFWTSDQPDQAANLDLALADFTRAAELEPGNEDHYLQRGSVYQAKGKFDLAKADFQKTLEIKPTHVLAKSLLAQVMSDQPQDCKESATVTITGKITSVKKVDDGERYFRVTQDKPGCKIAGIVDNDLSSKCVEGAYVDATGIVNDEGDLAELRDIDCK